MTDVASLVISVVGVWKVCVQVFDIVDTGKKYGMDYELLRVKLEVERIRLLAWGRAVGLSEVEEGRSSQDDRLNQEDVRGTVLRLLGCIHHIFQNSEKLQETYGLLPTASTIVLEPDDNEPPTQSQLILGTMFKRAYDSLRRSAKDRQRATPLKKKTIWAVHDKKKFQGMITEIKGFNDNLESLFPGVRSKTALLIRNDIDQSNEIQSLQLLQEATADDHEEMSETASLRLEALGATATARSVSSQDARTVTEETNEPPQLEREDDIVADFGEDSGVEMNDLTREMKMVELYVEKKSEGALTVSLRGPYSHSARVTSHVYWDGKRQSDDGWSYWDDRDKGFVKTSHASFGLYHRKKFIKKSGRKDYDTYTDEDYILFDVESDSRYENAHPGTVTVEGFGMECWDYEEILGKKRETTILVNYATLPGISAPKLLRRIDELRHERHKFGWNPDQEEADLKEFVGDMGITYYSSSTRDRSHRIGDLYSLLNRRDIFADFTSKSSIGLEWGGPKEKSIGMWNFFWQIIITKELALRLENHPDVSYTGLTPEILASLIVADLWLKNVEIVLTDAKIRLADIKKPESLEEKAKAEDFKFRGNEALKVQQFQQAADFYTEAIKIDLSNAIYRANRSAAMLSLEKLAEASEDAFVATQLDPKYAKGWARLGIAELRLGRGKKSRDAYQRAIELAGSEATSLMRQGLADAKAKMEADIKAMENEKDKATKDMLRKNILDQDWDVFGKTLEMYSHVHEQQVEGLLLFAERMKWPYINEVRDFAEDAYNNLRSGQTAPFHLHDWLFGMTLPGKWMSFKIMSALILCTPSISKEMETAHYYECGVSLRKYSYWRVRSVLGRVLGCLPGLISLCGWIGPCPSVEVVPLPAENKPRHIRLKARSVAPIVYTPDSDDGSVIYIDSTHYRYEPTRIQPGEEVQPYLAEMKDSGNWVTPEPPVCEVSTCSIQAIRVKKLPLDISVSTKIARQEITEQEGDQEAEYRPSIVFKMDNNEDPFTYTLYTNPVFVTPPACHSGPKGPHEVHVRELPRYQTNIWTVERLKHHTPDDFDDDVTIINATGKGAEVLARAWCSERGKSAIIRRADGPCFVCAVRAASKAGLGVGVLIWVA